MELPCRKCGKLTHFDRVAIFGAKTVCNHCGWMKPLTLRAHPVFHFLVLLIGFSLFMLINPFEWKEDALGLFLAASFMLFFWLPHLLAWKSKRSKPKDGVTFKIMDKIPKPSLGKRG